MYYEVDCYEVICCGKDCRWRKLFENEDKAIGYAKKQVDFNDECIEVKIVKKSNLCGWYSGVRYE